jgi:nicotinamidase/pyrazinamidase
MSQQLPIESEDALIVVDVQNDFCLGGMLAVEDAEVIIPVLNRWLEAAENCGAFIVFTRDWHPAEHVSFVSQGGPWPRHCVAGTQGAEFHPQLQIPKRMQIVDKGVALDRDNYSAFDGTGLTAQLRKLGVHRLWVGGLAQDVCVRATVLDACRDGFEVHLIADATRPIDDKRAVEAINEMQAAGAAVEEGPA